MIRKPKPLTADFPRFVDGASIGGAKNAMPEYERLQQLCLGIAQHANWHGNEPLGHVRLVLDRALSPALLASLRDKMADKLVAYMMPAAVAGVLATKEDATSEGVAKEIDWPALIERVFTQKRYSAFSHGSFSSSAFAKFAPTAEGAPEEQAVANEWTLIRPTVALDWWTARLAIPSGLLTAKSRRDFAFSPARRRALRIAHVEQQAVIDAAARGIQESLASTKEHPYGSRQFKQTMAESFDEVGMDPLKPSHVQLVYDQEMSNSYGAARTRTQEDKEVKKLLPYGIIHTIGDGRVRPMPGQEAQVMKTGDNHRVMDNLCMPLDDARWHGRIPPLYFRCRCVRAVVRKKPSGAKTEPSSEFVPKSGWGDGGMNAWDESEVED